MKRSALLVIASGLVIGAGSVHAQAKPYRHSANSFAGGVSIGRASVHCHECTIPTDNEITAFLRYGLAVRPDLVVSAEGRLWRKKETSDPSDAMRALLVVAQWWPNMTRGLYVSGGFGVGSTQNVGTFRTASPQVLKSEPLAAKLELGYDVALGGDYFATPFVSALGLFGGNISEASTSSFLGASVSGGLLEVGVAFTRHNFGWY